MYLLNMEEVNNMSVDESVKTKEQWYDLNKYKGEVQTFVGKKKLDLDVTSTMEQVYNRLYRVCFSGVTESDIERFPHTAEVFKVYKTALIEACLSGYSALVEVEGEDAESILKAPSVKQAMTKQFKGMALLENLSADTLDDWVLKGEAISYIKLKEKTEEYRVKETLKDATTGEEVLSFKIKQGVTYQNLDIERIDPLDFYVDALDYQKDPIGCTKIIRSWIDVKTLLSSDAYPLLSKEDKDAIIAGVGKNGTTNFAFFSWSAQGSDSQRNRTDKNKIEVLTFNGDFITSDNKILNNINAVLVGGRIASVRYNTVSTNRIIYAPYKVDRQTHRGISPLSVTLPVNNLINKVTDMFIKNLDDVSNPIMMYQAGSISAQQLKEARRKREIEYNDIGAKPEFFVPPASSPNGLQLMELVLNQNKNVLGLNNYMMGDSSGSVRTAEESSILFQKANARMRVETDVFSYRFLLSLFNSFYAFNRELALGFDNPLEDIYSDPMLKVSISTNAAKADKQGELQRLMQMLNLPIAQMIFSNLTPEQIVLAVRYLMAKSDLTDCDNLLQLVDSAGNPQIPTPVDKNGNPLPEEEVPTEQDIPMEQDVPVEQGVPIEQIMNNMPQIQE